MMLFAFLRSVVAFEKALETSSVSDKAGALEAFREATDGKSNADARDVAMDILGERIFWDWDRTCLPSPAARD